jgi:hypothetical protein
MSGPVSDDESSTHQMYAPKRIREQPRIPLSSHLRVDSPATSPSHPQLEGGRGSPSFGGDLEDEVPRRPYEPEPISQPQAREREYFWLRLINWIVIAVACTVLLVIIGAITKPLWQEWVTQPPLEASKLSDRFAMNSVPADTATGIVESSLVL